MWIRCFAFDSFFRYFKYDGKSDWYNVLKSTDVEGGQRGESWADCLPVSAFDSFSFHLVLKAERRGWEAVNLPRHSAACRPAPSGAVGAVAQSSVAGGVGV